MLKYLERNVGGIYLGEFDPAAVSHIIMSSDCAVKEELRDLVQTDLRYRHVEIIVSDHT